MNAAVSAGLPPKKIFRIYEQRAHPAQPHGPPAGLDQRHPLHPAHGARRPVPEPHRRGFAGFMVSRPAGRGPVHLPFPGERGRRVQFRPAVRTGRAPGVRGAAPVRHSEGASRISRKPGACSACSSPSRPFPRTRCPGRPYCGSSSGGAVLNTSYGIVQCVLRGFSWLEL